MCRGQLRIQRTQCEVYDLDLLNFWKQTQFYARMHIVEVTSKVGFNGLEEDINDGMFTSDG